MTKTILFGVTFDSQIEADRYLELRQLSELPIGAPGRIWDLETHPRYVLIDKTLGVRERVYTADFQYGTRYVGPRGDYNITVAEEIKPANKAARSWTRDFPLRLALAKQRYPDVEFRVVER